MGAEDRRKERAALDVVGIVVKHFEAYGILLDAPDLVGRAIADAAQSIEDRVK